jgi:hypothetical protein
MVAAAVKRELSTTAGENLAAGPPRECSLEPEHLQGKLKNARAGFD